MHHRAPPSCTPADGPPAVARELVAGRHAPVARRRTGRRAAPAPARPPARRPAAARPAARRAGARRPAIAGRRAVRTPALNRGGDLSDRRGMLDAVTARASSTVLVGREADLAALRDALKRARSAEPTAVLVGGEAGVGKTRLVEEFAPDAGRRRRPGAHRPVPGAGRGGPAVRAVRRRAARAAAPRRAGRVRRPRAASSPGCCPSWARPRPAADAQPRATCSSWSAGLFGRLADERPLVLVVEDLHWADRSTRDLIGFLVRVGPRRRRCCWSAPTAPTSCTAATRCGRSSPSSTGSAACERIELDRLDRDGTAEILTDLLGAEPEPARRRHDLRAGAGQPVLHRGAGRRRRPAAAATCPDSLRDLLLARVDRLPEPAQRVLRVAAAGGTRVRPRAARPRSPACPSPSWSARCAPRSPPS